jgi:two-component system LytT family response regulator
MIRCVAIDDEPLALLKVGGYIDKTPFLDKVAVCESAMDALEIMQSQPIDLIFVDINMPDINGMELVKSLTSKPGIIFTTAYSEYAIEGFKVDAIDYLLKPFDYPDFLRAALKAQKMLEVQVADPEHIQIKEQKLFIKSDHKLVKINLAEVTYIEGMREYVRIHLLNREPVMTLLSMNKVEDALPKEYFMRIHRSFIVNLDNITTVERNRIVFDKNVYIPVSEGYREAFKKFIDQYFL